jgi:hypothetical protein
MSLEAIQQAVTVVYPELSSFFNTLTLAKLQALILNYGGPDLFLELHDLEQFRTFFKSNFIQEKGKRTPASSENTDNANVSAAKLSGGKSVLQKIDGRVLRSKQTSMKLCI